MSSKYFFLAWTYSTLACCHHAMAEEGASSAQSVTAAATTNELITVESDIYYSWRPLAKDRQNEVESVLSDRLVVSGKSEAEVQARFKQLIPTAQAEAARKCKLAHESKANCIRTKMAQLSPDYQSLDIVVRRQITENVEADCESVRGICGGTSVSVAKPITEATLVHKTTSFSEANGGAAAKTATASTTHSTPQAITNSKTEAGAKSLAPDKFPTAGSENSNSKTGDTGAPSFVNTDPTLAVEDRIGENRAAPTKQLPVPEETQDSGKTEPEEAPVHFGL